MEEKSALGIDRPAEVDRHVRGDSRVDFELAQQFVEADARDDPAQAYPESSILVVHAHRDDRLLEAGVTDTGHCEKQLPGQEFRLFHSPAYRMPERAPLGPAGQS
jgi:hypothetical protein